MTDDTNTEETPEETPAEETPVEETPAAEVEAEAPAAEEAPAEEAPAEEPAAEAPAEEPVAEAGPAQTTPAKEHGPGRPKERLGIVVSDKADKTITVRIEDARRHRRYEKIVRSTSTLHAHDEANDANEGDRVTVIESRPLSRTKRWRLVEVLERAK